MRTHVQVHSPFRERTIRSQLEVSCAQPAQGYCTSHPVGWRDTPVALCEVGPNLKHQAQSIERRMVWCVIHSSELSDLSCVCLWMTQTPHNNSTVKISTFRKINANMRVELSSTDSEQRVDVGIAITCGTPCEKDQASRTVETLSGSEYSVHCGLCHSVSFDLDGGDGPFLNRNALSVDASAALRTPSTHAVQLASTAIPKIISWGGE